ncbi:N-acetyl-1-D-myo-inositol-2-amino-2-deoxy-alpha-D-glucopyranoside deacetylase [Cellulomonas timonensis]|uniref:N-acetyl-1-D-myo-inositol-2-amino-2-deoxy-alpha- D-glucopyranoside deacetylase n=1 Tax=Cellulomonas timonensis TaxID=1689271 RepID=UPI00082F7E1E|nr:N-acetyl-1-D-myo-inositol-2-amino-2-deoxy-alpha-D-glucopyranoside deacetylase [Cellulomonas timonensis]
MTTPVAVGPLVAVHAHPDDETLATGALLATWAASGAPVTVVTCTRGERGEVIGSALAHLEGDGPALAAHRTGELTAALARLGVRDQVFLDAVPGPGGSDARYADSGMAWAGVGRAGRLADLTPDAFVAAPLAEPAGRLARLLRTRRPAVVATYEPGGGYGHPDHVRAHEVATEAVRLAADPAWEPEAGAPHTTPVVLWAAQGESALRQAYAALAAEPAEPGQHSAQPALAVPDPDGPLPSVAVPDEEVDLVVDVAPVLPAVVGALRAHATQVHALARVSPGADPVVLGQYALSNDVLAPLLSAEGYRLAPGSRPDAVTWPTGVRRVA